jgi:hypothetical protein
MEMATQVSTRALQTAHASLVEAPLAWQIPIDEDPVRQRQFVGSLLS